MKTPTFTGGLPLKINRSSACLPSRCKCCISRKGFTLTEVLVVITLIVVLAALTFLFVSKARENARRSASVSNLRQFGVAFNSFVGDNAGCLPAPRYGSRYWPHTMWPYLSSLEVYLVPDTPNRPRPANSPKVLDGYFDLPDRSAQTPEEVPIRWNYVINGGGLNLPFSESYPEGMKPPGMSKGVGRPFMQMTDPSRTMMLTEGTDGWWLNGYANIPKRVRTWNNGTANILWCDGSLQILNPTKELRPSDLLVNK
jgi:prepilin-type N-terminal cleavage/methylation domain-containing protein/prepilin-type processing-associated H-X9-DG protein